MLITCAELMALGIGTRFVDCSDKHEIVRTVDSLIYGPDGAFDFRFSFVIPPRDHPAFELFASDEDAPGDIIVVRDSSFGDRGPCFRVVE